MRFLKWCRIWLNSLVLLMGLLVVASSFLAR